MPFGVHRVPDTTKLRLKANELGRHQCLSAFTAFPTPIGGQHHILLGEVTNAFRRSPRSRHLKMV